MKSPRAGADAEMTNETFSFTRKIMPPAVSESQRRYMAMCAHAKGQAKGKCPPHKVAQEFSHKPKGGYKRKKRVVPKPDSRGFY
jgi:hypothetical protein